VSDATPTGPEVPPSVNLAYIDGCIGELEGMQTAVNMRLNDLGEQRTALVAEITESRKHKPKLILAQPRPSRGPMR